MSNFFVKMFKKNYQSGDRSLLSSGVPKKVKVFASVFILLISVSIVFVSLSGCDRSGEIHCNDLYGAIIKYSPGVNSTLMIEGHNTLHSHDLYRVKNHINCPYCGESASELYRCSNRNCDNFTKVGCTNPGVDANGNPRCLYKYVRRVYCRKCNSPAIKVWPK